MLELNPQIIKTESGDLVVLTRTEYDGLVRRATDEDEDDVAIFDARMAELAAGTDAVLPPEVSAYMLTGDTLLKALRKWRGDTQANLALKVGIAQGYYSDLESGKKVGTAETMRTIAKVLGVDAKWLEPKG